MEAVLEDFKRRFGFRIYMNTYIYILKTILYAVKSTLFMADATIIVE